MKNETFFKNYELLIDAPNSVEELRELILQLAVKGKLVPQDPNEETASVLFEKIIADKDRLIKEKNFKKSKTLPEIKKDEIPFDVPKTWKWIRFNDVGEWGAGSTPDRKNPKYYEGSILWFKSGELNDGYIYDSNEKITVDALKDCSLRLDKPGDVLIAMYGATIGKVAILEIEATTNQAVCACTCFSGIYNCYLFYLLKAYRRNFSNQGAGGAQPNISRQKIIHTVAPLPPFEEQKRIVAKVDQLMALCDELEARQQKKHEQRIHLNNAALDKLLTAPTPEEFAQHWQRICDNFDLLYDAPETVGQLRQAILQLAVQGKLVAQDEGDEPASVLVKKIKAEKEMRVEEGNIKKSKQLPLIKNTEIPYEVPDGWTWVRLNDITNIGTGSTPLKSNHKYYEDGSIPWITSSLTSRRYIDAPDIFITQLAVKEYRLKKYPPDTLIIALYGQGKTRGQVSQLKIEATINQACAAIVFIEPFEDIKNYVRLVLEKKYDELRSLAEGGAQPNLNVGKIKETLIPVPPLKEQKRIVAKVDQLMALCDELEAGLVQAQTDGGKLMEAVVHHVLEV